MQKFIVIFLFFVIVFLFSGDVKIIAQGKDLTVKQADSIMNAVESRKYPQHKFIIYSGGLFSNLDGSIIVNGKTVGIGTKLDFEDNLGLTSYITTYRLEGIYNISRKSSLNASFLVLNRTSSILLNDSIKYGEYKFKGNAKFDFLLNFTYMSLNYNYNFVAKPQFNSGASVGLRLFRIRTNGTGNIMVNNQTEKDSFEKTMLAPGVLIGLNNRVYFLPNLYGRSSLEYFSLKIGNIRAGLLEASLSLEYYFIKNLCAGISALAYFLKIDSQSEDNFNGEITYNFKGLSLYLGARF